MRETEMQPVHAAYQAWDEARRASDEAGQFMARVDRGYIRNIKFRVEVMTAAGDRPGDIYSATAMAGPIGDSIAERCEADAIATCRNERALIAEKAEALRQAFFRVVLDCVAQGGMMPENE